MKRCAFLSAALAASAGLFCATAVLADEVETVKVKAVTHFDFAHAEIPAKDQQSILAEVGKMKDVTWQTITATGHTDSVGPEPVNEALSEQRAEAVKSYLVGKGLSPSMIKTDGKASEAPVASNDSAAGRAQNRRTEIEFQGVRTK